VDIDPDLTFMQDYILLLNTKVLSCNASVKIVKGSSLNLVVFF